MALASVAVARPLRRATGKLLYGATFSILLPVTLVLWARASAAAVTAPAVESLAGGAGLALCGLVLLAWGMISLWSRGGGLPMNAYPPERFVTRGIYRFWLHPIYAGFVLVCAGVSIATGSASGLWLVTPMTALGCSALVLGYERQDMALRFGRAWENRERLLPPDTDGPPMGAERVRCFPWLLGPWLLFYELTVAFGLPRDAISSYLPFERHWPVIEWTELIYMSVYFVTGLAPAIARTRRGLRAFYLRGWFSIAVAFPIFLTVPLVAPPRPFHSGHWLGKLLLLERSADSAATAFPSFHVLWALISSDVLVDRWPRLAWLWRAWPVALAASCLSTGMHSIVDLVAALAIYILAVKLEKIWSWMRTCAETIANSWREWRFGPVRVINHGFYAGAGVFVGSAIVLALAGPGHEAAAVAACLSGIAGAALWAQLVEGSPRLLRPFGYYGGLLGTVVGAAFAPWFGSDTWLILAAYSVAAPWVQSFGRLRCLVQGCCHGCPAPPFVGIVHHAPQSRVTRFTPWAGVPVHATPLYSILWNALVAAITARLWSTGQPAHLICGVYLMLSGMGRFVEEAFRGEPQTLIVARLRLYQWLAVASVLIGAILTTAGISPPAHTAVLHPGSFALAAAMGLVAMFAMGVDFPSSNRRFSRLA